jgi:beta-1,4-mannosyltransferase
VVVVKRKGEQVKIKIIMIPRNHEYIRQLKHSLEKIGIEVKLLKPFHYSSLTNIIKMLYFRIKGYKVIHVHWLYIFPFKFVMVAFYYFCKSIGLKIVWEVHNIVSHSGKEKDRINSQWFYDKVDGIIFHSQEDILRANEILKRKEIQDKKNIVIPHGNFNKSYENRISKQDARKALGIPNQDRVILCFGFIRKNRGYEYLLEAVKGRRNTTVVIAGKLLDKDVYKKLLDYKDIMPNLKLFVHWIPDDEIQLYFNACDIVVLPYSDITTSGVIPLAYAFSRPVVTTAIGGLKDIVNDNTGILVPIRNVGALRNAIEKILALDFESMGNYAHQYAELQFNWDSNAGKLKELYGSLCNTCSVNANSTNCKSEKIKAI